MWEENEPEPEFEGLTLRQHLATIGVWLEGLPQEQRDRFAHDFPRTWRLLQKDVLRAKPD